MNWIRKCWIICLLILIVHLLVNISSAEVGFEQALHFVLKWEGGYSNDPNDPGGETNFGICKKWYPFEDIKNMTRARAAKIYYENYWLKAGCDELPFPWDIIIFDTSVNMGRARANTFYEKSVDWRDFLLIRIQFYASLKTAKYFIRGWVNRTIDLYKLITSK